MAEEILYVSEHYDIDDVLDLDLDAFQRLYHIVFKREARDVINQFSTSALAYSGKKKTVQEFFKPYLQAFQNPSNSSESNDLKAFLKDTAKGGNSF